MTEPRRREANPRPPSGGTPGPRSRPRQGESGARADAPSEAYRRPAPPADAYRLPSPREDARRRQPRPSGSYPGRSPGDPSPRKKPPPGRAPRLWGSLPGRAGICLVIGSAAVGALVTALAGSEPGLVLGVFVVAGTVAAGLAVQPRAVYRIIPVPALSYLAAAVLAGLIRNRASGTSGTALALGATQWIASGFVAMTAATVLALALTAARWRGGSRGPHRPAARPAAAAPGGSRRRQAARSSPPPRGRQREADYSAGPAGRPRRDEMRRG